MKKIFLIVLATAFLTACQETLEEKCERECREYTRRNCPAKIEENTIMDSMVFDRSTLTIHHYYRLTGLADHSDITNQDEAIKALKNGLKNTTSMQACKDAGYNFAYTYRSQKDPGKVLLEVVLTSKDYQ